MAGLAQLRYPPTSVARSFIVTLTAQIDINLETSGITPVLELDGIPIELRFMSKQRLAECRNLRHMPMRMLPVTVESTTDA